MAWELGCRHIVGLTPGQRDWPKHTGMAGWGPPGRADLPPAPYLHRLPAVCQSVRPSVRGEQILPDREHTGANHSSYSICRESQYLLPVSPRETSASPGKWRT